MKRKVGLVIAGAMLHVGAHAAEQAVPAAPGKTVQTAVPARATTAVKKPKPRRKAPQAVASKPADPPAPAQDNLTETPPEEQSLQLKGVRG